MTSLAKRAVIREVGLRHGSSIKTVLPTECKRLPPGSLLPQLATAELMAYVKRAPEGARRRRHPVRADRASR